MVASWRGESGQQTIHMSNPEIVSHKWGEMIVDDKADGAGGAGAGAGAGAGVTRRTYRDCKLFPGGSREWDWRLTDTHHHPGIQRADLMDVLKDRTSLVILSTGMDGALAVTPEVEESLKGDGIEYLVARTEEAIRMYKKATSAKKRVVGLFHMTC